MFENTIMEYVFLADSKDNIDVVIKNTTMEGNLCRLHVKESGTSLCIKMHVEHWISVYHWV